MILDPSFLGNTLILLMMFSIQLGVFGDFFGDDDADDLTDEVDPDPLYDASLYTQRIDGTAEDDRILSVAGETNQAYFLGGGNDTLNGTSGDDYVNGGVGDDIATTLEGNDIIVGGDGDDRLFGGRGDDQLFGDAGEDQLEGSLGNDTLSGGDGNDQLSGGRDNDTLFGGNGDDILAGDRFDEVGGLARGVDTLSGGAGDDALWLTGNDTGTGGTGNDLFRVIDSGDPDAFVTITDFDPEDDRIEVVYEPAEGVEAPALTVTDVPDTQDALISLDGSDIAIVTGGAGLLADDVSLSDNFPTTGGG